MRGPAGPLFSTHVTSQPLSLQSGPGNPESRRWSNTGQPCPVAWILDLSSGAVADISPDIDHVDFIRPIYFSKMELSQQFRLLTGNLEAFALLEERQSEHKMALQRQKRVRQVELRFELRGAA